MTENPAMQRSVTFLDGSGDITLVWDEQTDEKMIKIIEDRMAKGYRFYILKPRAIPILPPRKVRAKSVKDIRDAGAVIIDDEDINQLFVNGDIRTLKADNDLEVVEASTDGKKIARSQTVAVRPARGG